MKNIKHVPESLEQMKVIRLDLAVTFSDTEYQIISVCINDPVSLDDTGEICEAFMAHLPEQCRLYGYRALGLDGVGILINHDDASQEEIYQIAQMIEEAVPIGPVKTVNIKTGVRS